MTPSASITCFAEHRIHSRRRSFLVLLTTFCMQQSPMPIAFATDIQVQQNVPQIGYSWAQQPQRQLIFMNNPEFLWLTKETCDLADDFAGIRRQPCARSLFNIGRLAAGTYRAWWEHRNMMPFSIHSGLLISNPSNSTARIILNNDAIETNSYRRGGHEFALLMNAPAKDKEIILPAGERVFLGSLQNEKIATGHFFAGVIDFTVAEGEISLEEVVFRKSPAHRLVPIGYSDRTLFNVHESLVYKGISEFSGVTLTGAEFAIDDSTPIGRLPVAYHFHEVVPFDTLESTCRSDRTPVCAGNALKAIGQPQQNSSWVTHIAPDPTDPNPKRKRAIVNDLIDLVLPDSTQTCPSAWPIAKEQCMRMSHQFFWYLKDFQKWRLPNWGNWGVHYTHPIRVKNLGTQARRVVLSVTADGASPITYKGTGISKEWRQIFLNPKSRSGKNGSIIIAEATVEPHSSAELTGEFILSGPGAGTLEHAVEISELGESPLSTQTSN